LTRTRKQLRGEIVQHTQRIQRVLEDANVKLDSVITDILGVSGRRILRAIIEGQNDPEKLAGLGDGRLHCSRRELVESLRGQVTRHHRFLLGQHLQVAVGASILTAAYYMLRDGTSYHDLGHDYFVRHNETAVALRLTQRLKDLGYEVDIRKAA